MSALDVLLFVLLALAAYGGYRRGAILQAFGLTGLILGVVLAVLVAPRIAGAAGDPTTEAAIAVGIVLVAAAAGNVGGWLAGSRLKRRVDRTRAVHVDRVGGAALSVAALLLATWFLALNLIDGPFPDLAREIRSSRIVAALETLPRPPGLTAGVQKAAGLLGFPDAFAGLPPEPADPVPVPGRGVARAADADVGPSLVEILADGCSAGFYSEGSGFVVAPDYIVTNAHVVAGSDRQTVLSGERRYEAETVLFDPDLDLAVLRVPGLAAPALRLATGEVARGARGTVLGYPGGRRTASPAAVRTVLDAVGHDIYGDGQIQRRLYELQAEVHPGNSGGPFVLEDGSVAAVVFASSTLDDHAAYAIAAAQIEPSVRAAMQRYRSVGTGPCAA